MRIDFKEICEMPNRNIDYLAYKGTKIGMRVGEALFTPVNQHINTSQIKSPSKRYAKTFFSEDVYLHCLKDGKK